MNEDFDAKIAVGARRVYRVYVNNLYTYKYVTVKMKEETVIKELKDRFYDRQYLFVITENGKPFHRIEKPESKTMQRVSKKRSMKIKNLETKEVYDNYMDCLIKEDCSKNWLTEQLRRATKFKYIQD